MCFFIFLNGLFKPKRRFFFAMFAGFLVSVSTGIYAQTNKLDGEATKSDSETAPSGQTSQSSGENTKPDGENTILNGEDTKPNGEDGGATRPDGEETIPEGENTKLDSETSQLGGENTKPDGETIKPDGEETRPDGENTGPDGENTKPDSEETRPDGENTKPDSEETRPDGENTGPDGENTRPDGENTGPNGENTGPDGENTRPDGENTGPDGENTRPDGENTGPDGENTGPDGENTKPDGENTKPDGENTKPDGENTRPDGENTRPDGENTIPDGENTRPDGENTKPDGENTRPDGENTIPDGENTRPDGENTKPDGENTRPDGENTKPDGENTRPDGENTRPDGENTKPDGENTRPDGEETRPDGENTRPNGANTRPDGEETIPDGENTRPDGENTKPDGEATKPNDETSEIYCEVPEANNDKAPEIGAEELEPNRETPESNDENIQSNRETLEPNAEGTQPNRETLEPNGENIQPNRENSEPNTEGTQVNREEGAKTLCKTTEQIKEEIVFRGEFHTKTGAVGKEASVHESEEIKITGSLQPAKPHLEKLADIVLTYHWTSVEGEKISMPMTVARQVPLEAEMDWVLFEGYTIGLAGQFEVELGYRLNEKEFYSNPIAQLQVIANQPPTNIRLSGHTVAENSPAGTVIGTFTTIDPDQGDWFFYGLIDNPGGYFMIIGDELRVAHHFGLDYENSDSYPITVRSVDASGNYFDKSFTIQVTDVPIVLDSLQLTKNSVLEQSLAGTAVARLMTNSRERASFQYELIDDAGGRFYLQEDILLVADSQGLDFETHQTHEITVQSRVTELQAQIEETFTIELINIIDIVVTGEIRDANDSILSTTTVPTGQPLKIIVSLVPDAEHRGQEAEIITMALRFQDQLLLDGFALKENNMEQVWDHWDGNLSAVPGYQRQALPEKIELLLYQGNFPDKFADSLLEIYAGYRLVTTGELVYPVAPVMKIIF